MSISFADFDWMSQTISEKIIFESLEQLQIHFPVETVGTSETSVALSFTFLQLLILFEAPSDIS